MIKGEAVYDDGHVFDRVGADYMSPRYFSYENDLVAPGRFVDDASVGYRFTGGSVLDKLSVEGNVTNFTNKRYISTVNTNNLQVRGYSFAGDDADNPNFMVGVPRQWFITIRKGM